MPDSPELAPSIERVIVLEVGLKNIPIIELKTSLVELEELTRTAGGEIVASLTQSLEKFQPATLIGKGKIEEIKQISEDCNANLLIIDHQLTGIQTRNLEKELGLKVLDRNQLILDIFAQRAQSYEGKLQVELAQMMDMLPRMVGAWMGSHSRQGAGIGTRGPGETALEVDRRRIQDRIKLIKKKLKDVSKNREQHRSKRQKRKIPSFSLIGYTNSGKSTLLNQLTHANTYTEDKVFATLDPKTKKIFIAGMGEAVITDTVGFIDKLPTHLVNAFKSTLEESAYADILLHVIDLANPDMQRQIDVVEKLLLDFNWDTKPLIYIFNKTDVAPVDAPFGVAQNPRCFISAQKGEGLEQLKKMMVESLAPSHSEIELFFPKSQEHLIFDLARTTTITARGPGSQGTICKVSLGADQVSKWKEFLV